MVLLIAKTSFSTVGSPPPPINMYMVSEGFVMVDNGDNENEVVLFRHLAFDTLKFAIVNEVVEVVFAVLFMEIVSGMFLLV
ncbi:MAG: hypothetical protein KGH61_00705 [Candidatus Micrarchaeota archaeon]|nr:hypothetical protein [Candidatus Micrarchaeota archaeon]MDE1864049.1 hypothetical protein [Candidatus Micrarchaeota archaeon]